MINIEEKIIKEIKKNIKELGIMGNFNVELEVPNNYENGNFSTNIAMKLKKELNENPRDIAQKIINNMNIDEVEKIEIAGPGFINFYLNNEFFSNVIEDIINTNDFIFDTNENAKYNIEFVSANPTGDLHLGHARNAVFGDTIANLLKKIGNDVKKEYYINDAGSQMTNLGLSVKHFYYEILGIESSLPNDGYGGEEIKNIAKKIYEEYNNECVNKETQWFVEYAYEITLKEIKRVLKDLNVEFDLWTSERDLYIKNLVDENLKKLEAKGDIYYKDDAMWLNTEKYFDDKDRVLKKSDGNYTYFASDVAYHINKFDRGFDKLIDVWGGDHHGYINRVKSAIYSLGYSENDFEVIIIQMINILQNNERVKMSKRKGTSVRIKDILKEIDVDVLRYFFLLRSNDTQIDFDLDLAKKETSENPIFYIQYAHARINTLLEKANEIDYSLKINDFSEQEQEIINKLYGYQNVIINAANKRLPHLVCNYLYELASLYHSYYNSEKIFNNNDAKINDKIKIAFAIKKILKDGLNTLGIKEKNMM